MRIAVLHSNVEENARKDEADTLVQVGAVSQSLLSLGYEPITVPFSLDLAKTVEALLDLGPAGVFNLVESIEGRSHLIHIAPAILDHLKLPYTGSRAESILLTSNKLLAKRLLCLAGIPTPEWQAPESTSGGGSRLKGPCIIKSVWEHASFGLDEDSVIYEKSPDYVRQEIRRRSRTMGSVFAEDYIEGREFNISVLAGNCRPEVLPPAEILFFNYPVKKPKIVDYRAKWSEDSFEYTSTVRSFTLKEGDEDVIRAIIDLSIKCWDLFQVSGYVRVDFRVDERGNPWVLEVNANPCLSPDSGFLAAASQAGLGYSQVIGRIMNSALGACRT